MATAAAPATAPARPPIGGRPPGLPLPAAVQSLLFLRWPIPLVQECRRRYGDVFRIDVIEYGAVVYVADPDVIREVFTGDPGLFHAGEANEVLEPVAGPRSILLLDEDEHLRVRKLLLPPFHGDAIQRYRELIGEVTRREIATWPAGEPFALRPRMQRITLEVIMRAVFGIEDAERLARLRELIPRLFDLDLIPMFFPLLRRDLGPWSPWGRFLRVRRRIDEILLDEIRRRRAEPAGDRERRGDVLSLLLAARDDEGRGMTEGELRDELVTLLLAGHETTATALAWTWERLVRHPSKLERLRREVVHGETGYLDAVVRESLRVRPVVMDVARKLTAPAQVGGYELPEETIVMPAIALVQLDERLYPRPQAFRPERFLGEDPTPYTWIPFGGGRRRCAGAAFAQLEMKIVIEEMLRSVQLRPTRPQDEGTRVRGVTLAPDRDGEVVSEPAQGSRS
jgi:cytochrome P450 family 135